MECMTASGTRSTMDDATAIIGECATQTKNIQKRTSELSDVFDMRCLFFKWSDGVFRVLTRAMVHLATGIGGAQWWRTIYHATIATHVC
jgi:hypothetical protein